MVQKLKASSFLLKKRKSVIQGEDLWPSIGTGKKLDKTFVKIFLHQLLLTAFRSYGIKCVFSSTFKLSFPVFEMI